MVEKHPAAAQALRDNLTLLGARNARLVHDDALRYLGRETEAFDLIFLDPPFRQKLLEPVLEKLFAQALLKQDGMIYLEQESEADTDFARFGLQVHRETTAGQVRSLLLVQSSG
jgi:16S rRNA (guanine966-N2)-methyltransferase